MEVYYTEKDLSKLVRLLHNARGSWESIATQLELSPGDVEAIGKKFNDPKDCLRESLIPWLRRAKPPPSGEQLARALESPPVGREDIARLVVPRIFEIPKKVENHSKLWFGNRRFMCVCFSLLTLLVVITGFFLAYYYQDQEDRPSPGKSLSLPILSQELLIGREGEINDIIGYVKDKDVRLVTLHGQAGVGKSTVALHVGHRMLELGYNVHYIKVEDFADVKSLEEELMEISGVSYANEKLENWAKMLTKKTLLILENVGGEYWSNDTSRQHLRQLFLKPLLDNTMHLQVLITSDQQDVIPMHADRNRSSYCLLSLISVEECVQLMTDTLNTDTESALIESDTADIGDIRAICNLVGNVPFAIKVLASTLSSGTSAEYIIQRLKGPERLRFLAMKGDYKEKVRSAIELGFHFVRPECQISSFLLLKFRQPFTYDTVSPYITSDVMRSLGFNLCECLSELRAKSFLEMKQYPKGDSEYHFHELIRAYLKNTNLKKHKLTETLLQAFWKNHLSIGYSVNLEVDTEDLDALTQILYHGDAFSFDTSIALITMFPFGQLNRYDLSLVVSVLVSNCEDVKGFKYRSSNALNIIQGYTNLLEYVICQEEHTEWKVNHCMDKISVCVLPIIEKLHLTTDSLNVAVHFFQFIKNKCLKTSSSHSICGPVWKYNLFILASILSTTTDGMSYELRSRNFVRGMISYSLYEYDMALHLLHFALEDTFTSRCNLKVVHDFVAYITLYDVYSRRDNLQGMEEILTGIRNLDFERIYPTDIYVDIIIPFLREVNETNLANKLHVKLLMHSGLNSPYTDWTFFMAVLLSSNPEPFRSCVHM